MVAWHPSEPTSPLCLHGSQDLGSEIGRRVHTKGTKNFSSPHGASEHGPDSVFIEVLMEEEFNVFVKKKNLLLYKHCDQGKHSSTTSHSHCLSASCLHLMSELDYISRHVLSTTQHADPLWLCKR